jgi:DhnA family fructose-bisphosphate aldolase class Ia
VVENCPAPVLIAGGPRMESTLDVLTVVRDSIEAGGRGVVFGRNIWQSADPAGMVRALRDVIDGEATPEAAVRALRNGNGGG